MAHGPGLTLDIAEKRWPGRDQPLFSGLRLAIAPGEVLAVVHAADAGSAEQARQALLPLIEIVDQAPALRPVLVGKV